MFFPRPRSRLRIWSRKTGLTVPSRVSPLVRYTKAELELSHGIPPAFRDGVHIHRRPPSGQSRVHQVTRLRTDGVHCRESAGTGAVVLKVARV